MALLLFLSFISQKTSVPLITIRVHIKKKKATSVILDVSIVDQFTYNNFSKLVGFIKMVDLTVESAIRWPLGFVNWESYLLILMT